MRLWVNKARTVLVSEHEDGHTTVALRNEPDDTWGPPIYCLLEAERKAEESWAKRWTAEVDDPKRCAECGALYGMTHALGCSHRLDFRHRESRA